MKKRITISDISEIIGVSTTTVTKALNNKPQVSDDMRKKIIETAKRLGYVPNRPAQALARKDLVFYVLYMNDPTEFSKYYEYGFHDAFDSLSDYRVTGILRPIKNFNSVDELHYILNEIVDKKVDGIVLTPIHNLNLYEEPLLKLKSKGVPILYLCNKIDEISSVGSIQLNSFVAGKMAAEFLGLTLCQKREIAIFAGVKDLPVHIGCINGFLEEAKRQQLEIKGVFETQDDKNIAYYLTKKVMSDYPNLGGIYISSYNSVGVCDCIEEMNMVNNITLIGQDIYPALADKMRSGCLKATLFQDQYNQAKTAILKLADYVNGNIDKIGDILITPNLVLRSNLECYSYACENRQ